MASRVRGVDTVSTDIDQLLRLKNLEELGLLEAQIRRKLDSNEPIDVEYWEHLLNSLFVWKARAKLQDISRTVINNRMKSLRHQQDSEAQIVQSKLQKILDVSASNAAHVGIEENSCPPNRISLLDNEIDPVPLLKIQAQEKGFEVVDEGVYLDNVVSSSLYLRVLRAYR